MKNFKKLLAMTICGILTCSLAVVSGCGTTGGTEGTLNIYALHKGYGVDWCESLAKKFKEQDWVKEKYPNLQVVVDSNDVDSTFNNQMSMGSASTYDIMFSQYAQSMIGDSRLLDLTDSVYNATVPNENVKVIDKMVKGFPQANSFIDGNGETRYGGMSYVNGMMGILYNATKLEELGLEVPVTTDEFIALMQGIKDMNGSNPKYPQTYSIINRANGYSYQMFSTWWAQYEGMEEYNNFYEGISDGSRSSDVFRQKGRLESLKVLESLFKFENGYLIPSAPSLNYLNAQLGLMEGKGLFHFNGDYFTTEMAVYKNSREGMDSKIDMLKNPVISSIVDRLTSIKTGATNMGKTNDQMLAILVRDIDNNEVTCKYLDKGVTAEDYEQLKQARNMVNSTTSQIGVIPTWSKNQEIACDFLKFMATDVAIETVLESTGGLSLPFEYDVKTKSPALYEKLEPVHKTKLAIYGNKEIPVQIIQEFSSFKLGKCGLTPLKSIEYNGKIPFESVFGLEKGFKTAKEVYDDDVAYWTADRWGQLLLAANMQ